MSVVHSQEKRNIKFNIADFNRIFDGFNNWRHNDVTVESDVVKPAGIVQICCNKMFENVLVNLKRRNCSLSKSF